jgi:hypothetical protein
MKHRRYVKGQEEVFILAEYLHKNGLIESHTPSALLHANIDHLLLEYQDKLNEYCANSAINRSLPIQIPPTFIIRIITTRPRRYY